MVFVTPIIPISCLSLDYACIVRKHSETWTDCLLHIAYNVTILFIWPADKPDDEKCQNEGPKQGIGMLQF